MAGVDGLQASLDVFDRAGEVFDQLGPVVEANDEEFILGVCGLHELNNGVAGTDELGDHGTGEIHDDTDGDGSIFCGEGTELLQGVIFVDEEVVLFEAGNETVHGVGDGDGDQDEVDIHCDAGAGGHFEGVGAGDGSGFCSGGRTGGGGC